MIALNRRAATASVALRWKLAIAAWSEARSTSYAASWCATGVIPASRLRPGSAGTATVPPSARMPAMSRSPTARSARAGIAWDGWKPLSSRADCARTSTPVTTVTHRVVPQPSARPASSATARYAGSMSLMPPPLWTRAA